MAGTLSDFIQQFTGGGTVTGQDAAQYLEKFTSTHPDNAAFDNTALHQGAAQYLGTLPADQFHQAAQTAFAQAAPAQQQSLLGSLLGGLQGQGVGLGSLVGLLGLNSSNPQQMGPVDYAKIANYARTECPQAMQQMVAEQPWVMKALGNPIVTGVLGLLAAKLVSNLTQH